MSGPAGSLHIARDQRTLFVSYVSGGCGRGGRAKVRETAREVGITVTQLQPEPTVACDAVLRLPQLGVKLSRPPDGRRLRGQAGARHFPGPRPWREVERGDRYFAVVPRLIGLAGPDALRALRHQGLKPRLAPGSRRGVVVEERPRPGSAPRDGRVTLRLRG